MTDSGSDIKIGFDIGSHNTELRHTFDAITDLDAVLLPAAASEGESEEFAELSVHLQSGWKLNKKRYICLLFDTTIKWVEALNDDEKESIRKIDTKLLPSAAIEKISQSLVGAAIQRQIGFIKKKFVGRKAEETISDIVQQIDRLPGVGHLIIAFDEDNKLVNIVDRDGKVIQAKGEIPLKPFEHRGHCAECPRKTKGQCKCCGTFVCKDCFRPHMKKEHRTSKL